MNPRLDALQPYPFERLRQLLDGVTPPALPPIRLSIGEPQHPVPALITEALRAHADRIGVYPTTIGLDATRAAIAEWCQRRYGLAALDPRTQVLPVTGTREALFAVAQLVVDPTRRDALVVSPNPFYQIYEGAALLAGATPRFINQVAATRFDLDVSALRDDEWARVQLVYVCTPGNPTGRVMTFEDWTRLFALSDRHGFVIASDECYSEIYGDESAPPLGALEAASRLGRTDFRRLLVFSSLSKRSNAPGLRSGAVIGDAALLTRFQLYRTYHGCAMSDTVQFASIAAWRDEAHVRENRQRYRASFAAVVPQLEGALEAPMPEAGFYLWARVPGGDEEQFTRDLFAATHVTVVPGRYLARRADGVNPGDGYVRIALVADAAICAEAAARIAAFCRHERRQA